MKTRNVLFSLFALSTLSISCSQFEVDSDPVMDHIIAEESKDLARMKELGLEEELDPKMHFIDKEDEKILKEAKKSRSLSNKSSL